MSLPVGTWTITTDTLGAGTLTVSSVDATGNVAGSTTVPSSGAVTGFFDAAAQTVALSNVTDPTKEFVVFSANLFQATSGSPKTTTHTESVLAGTYESYPPGTPVTTGRWVASLNQKVKEKDKEEKEKEVAKEHKDAKDLKDRKEGAKEAAIKERLPETLPPAGPAAPADPASLQQLDLRVAALEQRLATGQPFIGTDERPDVGGQAVQGGGEA